MGPKTFIHDETSSCVNIETYFDFIWPFVIWLWS